MSNLSLYLQICTESTKQKAHVCAYVCTLHVHTTSSKFNMVPDKLPSQKRVAYSIVYILWRLFHFQKGKPSQQETQVSQTIIVLRCLSHEESTTILNKSHRFKRSSSTQKNPAADDHCPNIWVHESPWLATMIVYKHHTVGGSVTLITIYVFNCKYIYI